MKDFGRNSLRIAAAILILFFFTPPAWGNDYFWDEPGYKVEFNLWFSQTHGSFKAGGNSLNLIEDLSLHGADAITGNGQITWGRNALRLSYWALHNENILMLPRNITLGSSTFFQGENVKTYLKSRMVELTYERALLGGERGELYALFGGRFNDYQFHLESQEQAFTSRLAPLTPEIGLSGRFFLKDNLFLLGRVASSFASLGGVRSSLMEFCLGARYVVLPGWSFGADYRSSSVSASDGMNEMDFTYRGPMISVTYQY